MLPRIEPSHFGSTWFDQKAVLPATSAGKLPLLCRKQTEKEAHTATHDNNFDSVSGRSSRPTSGPWKPSRTAERDRSCLYCLGSLPTSYSLFFQEHGGPPFAKNSFDNDSRSTRSMVLVAATSCSTTPGIDESSLHEHNRDDQQSDPPPR